jgi:hypothetical protein
VNGIAPGAIETEMSRGQPVDPAHIPRKVAWLILSLCLPARAIARARCST